MVFKHAYTVSQSSNSAKPKVYGLAGSATERRHYRS